MSSIFSSGTARGSARKSPKSRIVHSELCIVLRSSFIVHCAFCTLHCFSYWLNSHGTALDAEFAILKIALRLPFVWLLLESRKPIAG